jgi:hypothetical protein
MTLQDYQLGINEAARAQLAHTFTILHDRIAVATNGGPDTVDDAKAAFARSVLSLRAAYDAAMEVVSQ